MYDDIVCIAGDEQRKQPWERERETETEKLSLCHSVTLPLCHSATLSLCHSVTLPLSTAPESDQSGSHTWASSDSDA
ncbi:hypothetical protein N7455_001727 [Penicillium solitum]|uniref:uncharacterized protein n=1 Tax=Penicillium solitum TaxID=60172 RepID=UPI0032C3FBED|nr:hypothetical protein N7455_001727 [Penicillium solitum]